MKRYVYEGKTKHVLCPKCRKNWEAVDSCSAIIGKKILIHCMRCGNVESLKNQVKYKMLPRKVWSSQYLKCITEGRSKRYKILK